nr:membrane protein UL45 [Human alphaherpesvirus 1]
MPLRASEHAYRPLGPGTPPMRARLPAAAWVGVGTIIGGVVIIAALVLVPSRASWALSPCDSGWHEFNLGCISWDPTPMEHEQAVGGCSAPATLIPRVAAKQLAAVARVQSARSSGYWWVSGDGIRACLRLVDGVGGIDQFCEEPALRICYYPRSPGGFVQFVTSTRNALGLP